MSLNIRFTSLIRQIFLSDLVLCNWWCDRWMFWEIAGLLSLLADLCQNFSNMPQSFA